MLCCLIACGNIAARVVLLIEINKDRMYLLTWWKKILVYNPFSLFCVKKQWSPLLKVHLNKKISIFFLFQCLHVGISYIKTVKIVWSHKICCFHVFIISFLEKKLFLKITYVFQMPERETDPVSSCCGGFHYAVQQFCQKFNWDG